MEALSVTFMRTYLTAVGSAGRGLYVPVYKMCLSGAFPDHTVLSHDTLEVRM